MYKLYKKNNLSRTDQSGKSKTPGQAGGKSVAVSSPDDETSHSFQKARDTYVKDMSKEMMMSMNEKITPKGVVFSNIVMSAPLFSYTVFLLLMAPMATSGAFVDQAQVAYIARSSLRLLALNLSFFGGIHYGFGACNWEVAIDDKERNLATKQMALSCLPAIVAITSSSFLLFAAPL